MVKKTRPSPPNAEWDSLDVNVKSTLDTEVARIVSELEPRGYEIKLDDLEAKRRIDNYRVMMFRRASRAWTQGYTNKNKDQIRFTGPEVGALVGRHLDPSTVEKVTAYRASDGSLHASEAQARYHDREVEIDLAERELKNYFLNNYKMYMADRNYIGDACDEESSKELRITARDLATQIRQDLRHLLPVLRRLHGDGE